MIKYLFHSQSKTVTFAALLVGASTFISQLLGLVRDRLLASQFGASQELDIYFAAFRIPDIVYGIIIMGGISAVFLPVLAEHFQKSEEKGWELVSNVLNCFLILLILTCAVLAVFTPYLVKFIIPGFGPEQKSLAISLTRIMFLSPIFLGLSSIFSGVLQYFNRFFAYSIAPVLYNIGIILGILFFVPVFGLTGLAYGVILGAFFHWLIQIPAAQNSGFKYLPVFNFKYPGLLKIFKLMIPRIIGTTAHHLNLIIITAIASTLAVGSIAIFNFANNLRHFPTGIVGVSFALASFPTLSRVWLNGQKKEFLDHFSAVLRQILFLIFPVSILMFLTRIQITRIIFESGEFNWQEVQLTAASLGLFCLGIFALSLIPFMVRVYYSFQDTKTPVIIGLSSVALSVALSFLFIKLLSFTNVFQQFVVDLLKLEGVNDIRVVGLSLALSLAGILQAALLTFFLRKRFGHIRLREIGRSLKNIIIASALMAASVWLILWMTSSFGSWFQIILAFLFGSLLYLFIAYLLKSPEAKTIKQATFKQFTKN